MTVNRMDPKTTTAALSRQHTRPRATTPQNDTEPAALKSADRFIREPECREITGLSRSTRWRLERNGKFPRRRRISVGTTGWLASEIAFWVRERAA
jgi:prophage regulatory protein